MLQPYMRTKFEKSEDNKQTIEEIFDITKHKVYLEDKDNEELDLVFDDVEENEEEIKSPTTDKIQIINENERNRIIEEPSHTHSAAISQIFKKKTLSGNKSKSDESLLKNTIKKDQIKKEKTLIELGVNDYAIDEDMDKIMRQIEESERLELQKNQSYSQEEISNALKNIEDLEKNSKNQYDYDGPDQNDDQNNVEANQEMSIDMDEVNNLLMNERNEENIEDLTKQNGHKEYKENKDIITFDNIERFVFSNKKRALDEESKTEIQKLGEKHNKKMKFI